MALFTLCISIVQHQTLCWYTCGGYIDALCGQLWHFYTGKEIFGLMDMKTMSHSLSTWLKWTQ